MRAVYSHGMKARLGKDFFFESAHVLPKVPADHKCGRMHGHSFKMEVVVEGEVNPDTGWVYDFSQISRTVEPLVAQLDHRCLNDIPGLENPTVEVLAGWVWQKLASQLPGLVEIVVHETATSRCIYRGE